MTQTIVISIVLLWIIALLNLFLTLALVRRVNLGLKNEPHSQGIRIVDLAIGQAAPEFVAETLNGDPISLSRYSGHNVAFIFISPHCKACLEELPGYDTLYQRANRVNIAIILVSLASLEDTRRLAKEFDIHVPILAASLDNSFRENYKVMGTPSYCLLNDKGRIMAAGFVSELEEKINVL